MPGPGPHGQLSLAGITGPTGCEAIPLFFLNGAFADADLQRLCTLLFQKPVTEQAAWHRGAADPGPESVQVVEIICKPVVTTDTEAQTLTDSLKHLQVLASCRAHAWRYEFTGTPGPQDLHSRHGSSVQPDHRTVCPGYPGAALRTGVPDTSGNVCAVPLRYLGDEALTRLSRDRMLFPELGRNAMYPADIPTAWTGADPYGTGGSGPDLVRILPAQGIQGPDSVSGIAMLGAMSDRNWTLTVFSLPADINAQTAKDWLVSVFVAGAGVIRFTTDELDPTFKVKTHNHSSELDPFGVPIRVQVVWYAAFRAYQPGPSSPLPLLRARRFARGRGARRHSASAAYPRRSDSGYWRLWQQAGFARGEQCHHI